MTSEGGNTAAPLTQADIPELVKAVAEALTKPPPGDPSTSGGKLCIIRAKSARKERVQRMQIVLGETRKLLANLYYNT